MLMSRCNGFFFCTFFFFPSAALLRPLFDTGRQAWNVGPLELLLLSFLPPPGITHRTAHIHCRTVAGSGSPGSGVVRGAARGLWRCGDSTACTGGPAAGCTPVGRAAVGLTVGVQWAGRWRELRRR
jgi:hypothetical protein